MWPAAQRVAKKIIKFAGCYHGHVDSLLVSAGSAAATLGVPDSPGVTSGNSKDTIVLEYNDPQSIADAFQHFPAEIAAIILEPIVGNMGTVVPTPEFLKALRYETTKHGAILIFDEVMTGFRVAYGGAQSLFGIEPDLTTLGKIVGGGLPLAAYGGKASIMDNVMPAGKVLSSGHPIRQSVSNRCRCNDAGDILRDDPPYQYLEAQASKLAAGLKSAADAAGFPTQMQRMGSMMTLFFNDSPVLDWSSANRSDRKRFGKYFWGLIDEGVYMPCSQFEALFFSRTHSPEDIEQTIDAAFRVLAKME